MEDAECQIQLLQFGFVTETIIIRANDNILTFYISCMYTFILHIYIMYVLCMYILYMFSFHNGMGRRRIARVCGFKVDHKLQLSIFVPRIKRRPLT